MKMKIEKSEEKLYPNNGKIRQLEKLVDEDQLHPTDLDILTGNNELTTEGKVASFFLKKVNKIVLGRWVDSGRGAPDLFIENSLGDINNNNKFWVEAKSANDGLRQDQIRWFADHPNETIYVACVDWRSKIEFFKVKIERMINGVL